MKSQTITGKRMKQYSINKITILYPTCYEDIRHLGLGNIVKEFILDDEQIDYFEYANTLFVCNGNLPPNNEHSILCIYKACFGGIYCFTKNRNLIELEHACNEIEYYGHFNLYPYIEEISNPLNAWVDE